ncbi:MAG TPA: S-layer homology domain-containing protein [Papillibacter sp.]|nr:S-layer homology domain-containing protein [Papillibacter sp.]
MKTLKKVLSLTLVLVMALSFATLVSAKSVAEYEDASSITYGEAVDTLTGLGILNGYDNGNFGPQDKLTREQAAKIITYLLIGADAAENLKTSATSFSDVPADRWSAPFIQYCAARGIVNGIGNGQYAPEYFVTSAEFAKMLLGGLGYGKNSEYVGDDWSINVLVDAQNLGILNLGINYLEAATREQVAQYAFNAITSDKCYFVAFSKDKEAYVDLERGTLQEQMGLDRSESVVINGKSHFVWLRNGQPLTGKAWTLSTEKVLGTSNLGYTLEELSTRTSKHFIAAADEPVTYYVNGDEVDAADVDAVIRRGVTVSLIDNNGNGKYDVVSVIERTVGILLGDVKVGQTGVISMPGIPLPANTLAENVVGYEGLKKGDYVLYYFDETTEKYDFVKASVVQGMMTEGNSAAIQFAGALRVASGLVEVNPLSAFVSNPANHKVPAVAYLDESGAVIAISTVDTSIPQTLSYGFVVGYQYNDFYGTAVVKLVTEDGVLRIYEQAAGLDGIVEDMEDELDLSASNTRVFVSYALIDGKVLFSILEDEKLVGADYEAQSPTINIDGVTYFLTTDTKIVYFENGKAYSTDNVHVANGYKKSVAIDEDTKVNFVVDPNKESVITLLIVDATAELTTTTPHYAYVPAGMVPTMRVDEKGNLVHDYLVYVNGELTKLTGTSGLFTQTGLVKYDLSNTGYVTETSQSEADGIFAPAEGYGEVSFIDAGSYFVFENDEGDVKTLLIDENTKFYSVDSVDGTVSAGELVQSNDLIACSILYYTEGENAASAVYFTTTYKF